MSQIIECRAAASQLKNYDENTVGCPRVRKDGLHPLSIRQACFAIKSVIKVFFIILMFLIFTEKYDDCQLPGKD